MAPARQRSSSNKKDKVFHPSSRKASQLARKSLRNEKLVSLVNERHKKHNSLVNLHGFFFHAMPEEGVLTLEELHHIVQDIWLTRFDEELEHEKSIRRKGRPKSTKTMKLEEIKLRETEGYRTGMEVIDLTHAPTVELFRKWDQKELAYLQSLQFIRIFSTNHHRVVIARPWKNPSMAEREANATTEVPMDVHPYPKVDIL